MRLFIKGFCAVAVLIVAFVSYKRMNDCDYVKAQVNLDVTSRAFEDGGMIPKKYTGRGDDISPHIKLKAIDKRAKTIAIINETIPKCKNKGRKRFLCEFIKYDSLKRADESYK